METAKIYRLNKERLGTRPAAMPAISSPTPQRFKLLDQVRHAIRIRHYSPKTEESYVHWIKRFLLQLRKISLDIWTTASVNTSMILTGT